jgi:hypothetical protein
LKPDVFPLRRRPDWVDRAPRNFLSKGAPDALPCENDRAKPDRISRLARSTNCQRSLRVVRLSGTPWIEARTRARIVLELGAQHRHSAFTQRTSAFWREPFKAIRVRVPGQGKTPAEPRWITRLTLRKRSKSGQQKSLEPLGLAGDQLPGHAMACSLWDSLQGFNGAHRMHFVRPYEPASHFPPKQISTGQATRPPGGSTAQVQLHKSSTTRPEMQTHRQNHIRPLATGRSLSISRG